MGLTRAPVYGLSKSLLAPHQSIHDLSEIEYRWLTLKITDLAKQIKRFTGYSAKLSLSSSPSQEAIAIPSEWLTLPYHVFVAHLVYEICLAMPKADNNLNASWLPAEHMTGMFMARMDYSIQPLVHWILSSGSAQEHPMIRHLLSILFAFQLEKQVMGPNIVSSKRPHKRMNARILRCRHNLNIRSSLFNKRHIKPVGTFH